MSLYDQIVGHENIIQQLQQAIEMDKVNHAYILSGMDGAGKMMVAQAFAEALLCEKQGAVGCGVCHTCKQTATRNNPDLKFVTHEKPNSIGVDDIREQLVEDIQIKPYNGYHKVYILDEAEKMTPQAQNAILKTIEEPPSYGVILLLTNNIEAMLPTIRSRCIHYELRALQENVITEYLIAKKRVPDYEARVCASFSQGSMGKAILLAESEAFSEMKDGALSLVRNIYHYDVADLIDQVKKLSIYKKDKSETKKDDQEKMGISEFLDILGVWYRDALLFKVTNDANRVIFTDEINLIRKQGERSSYEGLENILNALETAKVRLKANVNFDLTMELLLLNMKEN